MSGWTISTPFRDRDESLVDVAANAWHLPAAADRAVARQLAIGARLDGMHTAGELIDHLGGLEPEQRRAILDAARAECGLPTTGEVEQQARFETLNRAARAVAGEAYPTCGGVGCTNRPVNPDGSLRPVVVRKWFCDAHRHLATERDLQPRTILRRLPSGGFVEESLEELEYLRSAEQSRAHQREARLTEAAVAGAELAELEAVQRARIEAELPEQMRRLA